jgi:hypothetical protein
MESTRLWTNFDLEWTADSSPTLRLIGRHLKDPEKNAESMHHSGGAASETVYIYGQATTWVLKKENLQKPIRICSVGLGLGYNEILIALLVYHEKTQICVDSFEIDPELKTSWMNWIFEPLENQKFDRKKNQIYDRIFLILSEILKLQIDVKDFKIFLQQSYDSAKWTLKDELNSDKIPHGSCYHLCLFDAFSQKTSGELWTEEFLNAFISQSLNKEFCLLATYACTGLLSRTLKHHNFKVTKKPGFNGKRDSTWAERQLDEAVL